MRGWEIKSEWEVTGRGAGNEFRVEWSLGMRHARFLELLVGVKSFNRNPGENTQDIIISIFNPSILSSVWLAFALFKASRLH